MGFTAESIAQDNICVIWVDDMIDVFTWRNTFGITIQTPNLDRLLNRGVRFGNAYATIPLCAPCRAELATGLSPFRSGLVDLNRFWRQVLPPEKAWAYDLRRAGFYNFTTGKVDATYKPMPERYRRVLFHEDVAALGQWRAGEGEALSGPRARGSKASTTLMMTGRRTTSSTTSPWPRMRSISSAGPILRGGI